MTELVRNFMVAGAVVSLPIAAQADPALPQDIAGGVLHYALFEAAVPHADLAECPATLARDDRFCRLTLGDDGAVVWAFALEGEQPLQAVLVLEADAFVR